MSLEMQGTSSVEATPASGGNRLATGGVRANRVGVKLPPRAIAVGRRSRVVYHQGPLAREISAGCAPKGARPPAVVAAQKATFARCAGLDRSSNRARTSFRLQKLTSGARFRRPRVNNPSPPHGSSSSLREQPRRAKKRRRPARGGKAMGTVAGSLRESGNGGTCRWKAPRIRETALVDERAVEAVLALRGRSQGVLLPSRAFRRWGGRPRRTRVR
jgi:hypothetical protein